MSRSKKSIKNSCYALVKQIIVLLLNFLVKTIFIRTLGKEYLGINGLFNNLFLLFSFAEFGLGSSMIYSFYEPLAKEDYKKCSGLYQYYQKMYLIMSGVVLLMGIVLIPFLPYFIEEGVQIQQSKIVMYFLLYILSACINNIFSYKANIMTADQNQYLVSKAQLILEIFCYIGQGITLLVFKSFFIYLLFVLFKVMILGIWYSSDISKYYQYLKQEARLEKKEKETIFNNTITLFQLKFSKTLIHSSDNVIISLLVGTIAVGYYSNYEFVIVGVQGIIAVLFSAVAASVGNFIVEQNEKEQYRIYEIISLLNYWISCWTSICLLLLFQDFIVLWAGKSYQLNFTIVILLVIIYYLRVRRESISVFREAAGIFTEIKNITMIAASMNLLLSLLLGKWFGMAGIFFATIVSVLTTYFWYEPFIVYKKVFQQSFSLFIKQQLIELVHIGIIYGITWLFTSKISQVTIGTFIIKCMICVIVPNCIFLLFIYRKKQFQTLIQILKEGFSLL